jgi:hypothetical protein
MRIFLLLCALELCCPIFASQSDEGLSRAYLVRGPHGVDMGKTVKCRAVSSVVLREGYLVKESDTDSIVAAIKSSSATLELTLAKKELTVREANQKAQKYTVTIDTDSFLGAMLTSQRPPVVNSILIDKERGYASWTTNVKTDSETEFLLCE